MDAIGLLLRVAASLVAVLGLVWMVRRGMLRSGGSRARAAVGSIEVLARQQLSGRASVALVAVGEVGLVLGVTDSTVTLLDQRPAAELLRERETTAPEHRTPVPLPTGLAATAPTTPAAPAGDPADLPTQRAPRHAGALSGSALSPATWNQAVEVLRERTARR